MPFHSNYHRQNQQINYSKSPPVQPSSYQNEWNRNVPNQYIQPHRLQNVGSLQAAQSLSIPQKKVAMNGRYQTFATFVHNVLRVWIKNLNDPSIVYQNEFKQAAFEKLTISYIAKTLIQYLLSKQPVSLSDSFGDILLSVPMTDLPAFTLKRDESINRRGMRHYKMTM